MNLNRPLKFTEELVQLHQNEEKHTISILQLRVVLIEEERYILHSANDCSSLCLGLGTRGRARDMHTACDFTPKATVFVLRPIIHFPPL